MPIGLRLRQLREEKRITQEELAERVGVARNSISRLELGYNYPSIPLLEKLAENLGVEPGELFRAGETAGKVRARS